MSIRITGQALRKVIHYLVKGSCGKNRDIRENGDLAHVSGIKYKYRCTGYQSGVVETLDWDREQRTTPVVVEDQDELIMNTNHYAWGLIAQEMKPFTILVDDDGKGIRDVECLVNHVRSMKQIQPSLDQRILVCSETTPSC